MKLFKNIKEKKFIIIIIVVFVFFCLFLLKSPAKNIPFVLNSKSIIIPVAINTLALPSLPVRIKIPKIGIDSMIEHVGLTKDGAVGSPEGPNNVAWFNNGPIPGSIGSAIVNGHSGWINNAPAVFDDLYKLKENDKIYIENESGIIITFIVKNLKKYDKNDTATDVFNSNDNKSHLNLITCTGTWNTLENTRNDRIVVFADLMEK